MFQLKNSLIQLVCCRFHYVLNLFPRWNTVYNLRFSCPTHMSLYSSLCINLHYKLFKLYQRRKGNVYRQSETSYVDLCNRTSTYIKKQDHVTWTFELIKRISSFDDFNIRVELLCKLSRRKWKPLFGMLKELVCLLIF